MPISGIRSSKRLPDLAMTSAPATFPIGTIRIRNAHAGLGPRFICSFHARAFVLRLDPHHRRSLSRGAVYAAGFRHAVRTGLIFFGGWPPANRLVHTGSEAFAGDADHPAWRGIEPRRYAGQYGVPLS